MARHKNTDWNLPGPQLENWSQASVAVLMDIRDELQALNRIIGCPNFIRIPQILDQISKNTTKPRKRKPKPKTK